MTSSKPVSENEKGGREGGGDREEERERDRETLSESHDSGLSIPPGTFTLGKSFLGHLCDQQDTLATEKNETEASTFLYAKPLTEYQKYKRIFCCLLCIIISKEGRLGHSTEMWISSLLTLKSRVH